MNTNHYEDWENDFIKAKFAEGWTDKEIGEHLGRTAQAIQVHRSRIGAIVCKMKPFTSGDLRFMRENAPKMTKCQIAKALGRTVYSIESVMRKNKISTKKPGKFYSVYQNGEPIAIHLPLRQCCRLMGIRESSFHSLKTRCRSGELTKWEIYTDD